MKALVLTAYGKLEYRDVPEPGIGSTDVLVAVEACGICGSDVHGIDGSTGRRQPPVIMGHEAAGIIVETGTAVKEWRKGDRVTFDSTVYCGACAYCECGEVNLCDNRMVLGVSCDEYRRDGAFAELVAVPRHILYRMPDDVSFEQAAMVEPVSIALHAVKRVAPAGDETAVVVGTGLIGLFVVQALRASGCSRVIGVDVDDSRLELARSLGASDAINASHANPAETVRSLTAGRGADVAFEVVGDTGPVQAALSSVRKGGRAALVGNVSPSVDFPLQVAVTRELTVYGSCASAGEYPECMELIADRKIDTGALLSGVAPLADGAAWFDRLYSKEPGLMKVVLEP